MEHSSLIWKPAEKKNVYSTRVFDIQEIRSVSPENKEATFFSLHASDWVIVIPAVCGDEGNTDFLMVWQWRHGASQISLEFPGGVMDEGETPEEAAKRELLEETGFMAGTITFAGTLSPNPAIMDNHCHVFIAEQLTDTKETDLDDDEFVTMERISASDVCARMGKEPYIHGLMSAALLLYLQKKGCIAAPEARAD